jgi:Aldehyde dehydrogenase family
VSVYERARLLANLAVTLRKNKDQLAKVITTEMGKISSEAVAEIEKCAMEADWYPEHGPQMFADAPAATGKIEAYVSYLTGTDSRDHAVESADLAVDAHGNPHDAGGKRGPGEALT